MQNIRYMQVYYMQKYDSNHVTYLLQKTVSNLFTSFLFFNVSVFELKIANNKYPNFYVM